MLGTLSYNRRPDDGGGIVLGRGSGRGSAGGSGDVGNHHCRYYATERRRQRPSSFSIMKWFRRSKHYDEDSTWFRDNLKRIRQAYIEQEPDYAAVTPVVPHRRPTAAATWSKWSGSTTTVYSFAYIGGPRRDGNEFAAAQGRDTETEDDYGEAVTYIDAATLPVARRRTDRRLRDSPPITAAITPVAVSGHSPPKKSVAPTLNRSSAAAARPVPAGTSTTMSTTRRREKRLAPAPPLVNAMAGPSSTFASKTPTQRRTATVTRKKYRAPQPPTRVTPEPHPKPPQQSASGRRAVPTLHRRGKGPAPKPPVEQADLQQRRPKADDSNVRRKITQYERDRLLDRVDKIERHFLEKDKRAAAVQKRGDEAKTSVAQKPDSEAKKAIANPRPGFVSVAALYTAMAATNLTELDKRAAEICRRNRLEEAEKLAAATANAPDVESVTTNAIADPAVPGVVANVLRRPAFIADDHKNAIVAAVLRKSYPTAVADKVADKVAGGKGELAVAAAVDGKRSTATRDEPLLTGGGSSASFADDQKQLVRHKRLAFFEQRAAAIATSGSAVATTKASFGTQTTGTVVVAKTLSTRKSATAAATAAETDAAKRAGIEVLSGKF